MASAPIRPRSRGRAIIALDVVQRTESHANAGRMVVPMVLAGVEPAVVNVRALMVYFVESEINQVGMAGVPELVQTLRGTTYVHPRRGLVHEYYFLLLTFPEHFFITFFGAKVTKSCEK